MSSVTEVSGMSDRNEGVIILQAALIRGVCNATEVPLL